MEQLESLLRSVTARFGDTSITMRRIVILLMVVLLSSCRFGSPINTTPSPPPETPSSRPADPPSGFPPDSSPVPTPENHSGFSFENPLSLPLEWGERIGSGGNRYAVPPGWKALVGEEVREEQRKKKKGMKMLPEHLRALTAFYGLDFVAYQGENLLLVYALERNDFGDMYYTSRGSPQFWRVVKSYYQDYIESLGKELEQINNKFQFRIVVDEAFEREYADSLGAIEISFRIQVDHREYSARSMHILYMARTITIIAIGDVPFDEFLRRSTFPKIRMSFRRWPAVPSEICGV